MNFVDKIQGMWSFFDLLPEVPLTPTSYIVLSIVTIVIGATALRGNPTSI